MHTPLKTSYNLDRFKIKGSIGKGYKLNHLLYF